MRLTTILIGSLLLILSIGAMFLLGHFLNPPSQQVFVAAREIRAGEQLTPDVVRLVSVRLPDASPYVTSGEIDRYGYTSVVEPIHQGMFIPKAALSFAENPAAANRVSLSLGDPNLVAMTIPVTPLTSPEDLVPGDKVSLDVSVGSASLLSGTFGQAAAPTPEAFSALSPTQSAPLAYGSGASPFATPEPTTTPTPRISLPVTKNLVASGRVLSVVYAQTFNPASVQAPGSSTLAGSPQEVRGDIKALVVAVPRSLQEALAFAIANGEVRVAVLDPNAPDVSSRLTAGMSWDDLVAYFEWQRQEWLKTPQPAGSSIDPPGAASRLDASGSPAPSAGLPQTAVPAVDTAIPITPLTAPSAGPQATPTHQP